MTARASPGGARIEAVDPTDPEALLFAEERLPGSLGLYAALEGASPAGPWLFLGVRAGSELVALAAVLPGFGPEGTDFALLQGSGEAHVALAWKALRKGFRIGKVHLPDSLHRMIAAADADAVALTWRLQRGALLVIHAAEPVAAPVDLARAAVPEDLPRLREYEERYNEEMGTANRHPWERILEEGRVLVVDAPGERVAAVLIRGAEAPGWSAFGGIWTFPGHRRKGYAKDLVAAFCLARQDEGKGVCFFPEEETAAGRGLANAVGLRRVGGTVTFCVTPPEPPAD